MSRNRVLAATAVTAAAVSIAPLATAGERPSAGAAATTVSVTGKEYKFILSRRSAPHGRITFKFTNRGKIKHDFKIDGKRTRVLAPNKSQSITVRLSAGRYRYVCTVKGHAEAGMKGRFRVT